MNTLIHHHLDHHALLNPQSIAVYCRDEEMTYSALQSKANQLAHKLIELDIKPGSRVGIYMDKCLEMAVAIYGILKAGAVYVPLDPFAPSQRIANIIDDCDINVVLSNKNKKKHINAISLLSNQALFVIGIDECELQSEAKYTSKNWHWVFDGNKKSNPVVSTQINDLAYIIYTSGSTGIPKGIMHTHRSCLSYVYWAVNEVNVQAPDRLGNHCPLHFDISIFDWFAAAVAGASTIVIPDEYTKMPASYSQLIAHSQMTVLFTVPFSLIQLSQYGCLEEHDLSHLRWVTFAGEPMPSKHLRTIMKQLPYVTFDNMYGPAETNVCTHYRVPTLASNTSAIPIGEMCECAQALIIDENEQAVGSNEIGELLVHTPTMMKGYWARDDLNKKAFFTTYSQSENDDDKQIYYRTGDLVKIDEEGLMWFIGRKDRQVKIRGYRVELDEIEAAIVSHSEVEEAAVYTVTIEDQPTQLHAAFTTKTESTIETKELTKYLKAKIPHYAVPSSISKLQIFPRTSSDKIDRNELSKEAMLCL